MIDVIAVYLRVLEPVNAKFGSSPRR